MNSYSPPPPGIGYDIAFAAPPGNGYDASFTATQISL